MEGVPNHTGVKAIKLTYQMLKEITDDFAEERQIGSGACGIVYKGVHENGQQIAVKTFCHLEDIIDDKRFQNEFQNLSRLEHQNIVQLVGYCNETEPTKVEFEGKNVIAHRIHMAICMDYVDNGSLTKHISGEHQGLHWHVRYKIIKGICKGLKYFSEGSECPILHLDLKPDNILLDKNMNPKIADFGLSRLFTDDKTQITKSFVGTRGYIPPEYIDHQYISKAFDIFSLGVIIREIMVGRDGRRNNVDLGPEKFVDQVRKNWRKRLQKESKPISVVQVFCHQVKTCIQIALKCLKPNYRERPTIKEIVCELDETEAMIRCTGLDIEQLCEAGISSNSPARPRKIPFSVLARITNGFSKEQLLSECCAERVYKGIYKDGELIAVMLSNHAWLEFNERQIEAMALELTSVNHQNIVRFVGYGSKSYDETKMVKEGWYVIMKRIRGLLCFEYHKNIRLDQLIQEKYYIINWQIRYGIIKGICEGLRYLQDRMTSHVYRLDLEPRRILVDENMVARIGYSWLTSFDKRTSVNHAEAKAPGCLEHLQPEYKTQDIYSLGILIMQTMAWYEDYEKYNEWSSAQFVDIVLCKCKPMQQGTPDMLSQLYFQQMRICIQIALSCVQHDAGSRPAIVDIICKLNETESMIQKQLWTLEVLPRQLRFPFEPRKYVSRSLQLNNRGDDSIAFKLMTQSPTQRFLTRLPLYGVVPPGCTYTLTLTTRKRPQLAPSTDNEECFTLQCVVLVAGDLDLQNVNLESMVTEYDELFKEVQQKAGTEMGELTLKVVCDPPKEGATLFRVLMSVWRHLKAHLRVLGNVAAASRLTLTSPCHLNEQTQPTQPAIEIIGTQNAQQTTSIEVHPTESWIMTIHQGGSLRIWNYRTMALLESFEVTDEPVYAAKFIIREKWIMAGDGNGYIHVYCYSETQDVKSFQAHDGRIISLAVHPTDPYVLSTSSNDNSIKLWNWENWECTRKFDGHSNIVPQVTFNQQNTDSFASASWDGTVKVWSLSSNICNFDTLAINGHQDGLSSVDYFTCGARHNIVARSKDGTAQIWDLKIKRYIQNLEGHTHRLSAVYCHPELSKVITGSLDGTVQIWDSFTYRLENIIALNLGAVYAFGYISSLRRVLIGCRQGIATTEINLSSRSR
ncbi:unnamed protein product [Urochloa decumbens]|uniref:Uncharacterized protein n=1 Tax=Urochloa decumbens TaxID=240449 RepID=A0ABC9AU20_9POAL